MLTALTVKETVLGTKVSLSAICVHGNGVHDITKAAAKASGTESYVTSISM